MEALVVYLWIFPALVTAKVATKDTIGFLILSTAYLIIWACILAMYLGGENG